LIDRIASCSKLTFGVVLVLDRSFVGFVVLHAVAVHVGALVAGFRQHLVVEQSLTQYKLKEKMI
jgi:hypothetical protein